MHTKQSSKMQVLIWTVGLLMFALNGVPMVSARDNWQAPQTMFLFGDSFVDTGNIPRLDPLIEMSRQWHYPYGVSYQKDDGSGAQANATGRFSDYMVQSDFIAKMLGLGLSPPTYQSTHGRYCDPSGTNFAFTGTGVNRISFWIYLGEQVDEFEKMIKRGIISKNLVTHSVALVAVSGNDYNYKNLGVGRNFREISSFAENITTKIAANVARLRSLGVQRVLVNNLHPLGCTPSQTRRNGYDACDDDGNKHAAVHNAYLQQKLGEKKGVFIVDLNTAFGNIIGHGTAESSGLGKQFTHSRTPCCISNDPEGYCGQQDENSEPLYSLCADPSRYFFWDELHPTHAGWEAIIKQLEDPIKEFVGQGRIQQVTNRGDAPPEYVVAL